MTSETMSAGFSESSSESSRIALDLEESADRELVHPCPILSFAGAHCFGGSRTRGGNNFHSALSSGLSGVGRHFGAICAIIAAALTLPTRRNGMLPWTSKSIRCPYGAINHGAVFETQTKLYPICITLLPTESTHGVSGSTKGVAGPRSILLMR